MNTQGTRSTAPADPRDVSEVLERLAAQFPEYDARDLHALADGGALRLPATPQPARGDDDRVPAADTSARRSPVRHRA